MSRMVFLLCAPLIILSCTWTPYIPPARAMLPDPFLFAGGTRMTQLTDWPARRAEIAAEAQQIEFGDKPGAPLTVTGAMNGSTLRVTCGNGGAPISFDCPITYPSGTGPFPAMIALGGSSMSNLFLSLGVAVITFPNDTIAAQVSASSRGTGLFYTLYGDTHSAGALMAWAWGVSRVMDALASLGSGTTNIDPTHIGVTGCSRNGKGALVCGAFDERIVLTIPQESGSGGAASWRVSRLQTELGQVVQTLNQIVGENCWFRSNFGTYASREDQLPFDHHMIEALCAPRGLLVIENTSMEWLGNWSTWVTANTAHKVWEALDVPGNMGYSQVGHANHCEFIAAQQPMVTAYARKFLLGLSADTTLMATDAIYRCDSSAFISWTTPTLN